VLSYADKTDDKMQDKYWQNETDDHPAKKMPSGIGLPS